MATHFATLVFISGVFNLAFAAFHLAFWKLFRWPEALGSMGPVNRGILYVANMALIVLFLLVGVLLLAFPDDVQSTGLGCALLAGMALFWLARAAVQPPVFGLRKPLSIILFLIFLFGAGAHGLAALATV